LVRIPERKRQLGRPRCRWEYNLKIDLQDYGFEDGDWSYQT
jgi:polyisoprenoid-binding protein YceI